MVPHTPSFYVANHGLSGGHASVREHTKPWNQAGSPPYSPPNCVSSSSALSLSPDPRGYPFSIYGSPYEEAHHRRTFSHSTPLTQGTSEPQRPRASSATSVSSPPGIGSHPDNDFESNARRYFCPNVCCGKTFKRARDQKRHISEQHEGTKYICKLCRRGFARPEHHKSCGGAASEFDPTENYRSHGCGFCFEYSGKSGDYDKWMRHVQVHQIKQRKAKSDWNTLLELQSLLRNPVLVTALACDYSSPPITSLTWPDDAYHEVKGVLETIEVFQSFDRLQIVFQLASPIKVQPQKWPTPVHTATSMDADISPLSFGDETSTEQAPPSLSQTSAPNEPPSLPGNFAWEERGISQQQTERTLKGIDEAIAGRAESERPGNVPMTVGLSQSSIHSYGDYLPSNEDNDVSWDNLLATTYSTTDSYFDEALGQRDEMPEG